MAVIDDLRGERQDIEVVIGQEALIAKADTTNALNAIAAPKAADDGANDIVEAGTEPSTGDNTCMNVMRVEENLLARARTLHQVFMSKGPYRLPQTRTQFMADVLIVTDVVRNEVAKGVRQVDGRGNFAFPQ
ncbi:hypothetical protein TPSea814_000108a [Treponema pallidum subsp. pallidum str. Sea 81-4]|nr:hypothetical protein TPSea814_000108a [Treponema pallidum subsp. pallidum str. Sea 81-4]